MKRTTVFLDEALERKAKELARKRGVSLATVVREAIAAYVMGPAKEKRLPSVAGAFSSGHTDTAQRVDDLLWSDPHG